MRMMTLTKAGQYGPAGAARLRAGAPVSPLASHEDACSAYGTHHIPAIWSVDVIAEPTTTSFMVFDGKNRPTRQPSEPSP